MVAGHQPAAEQGDEAGEHAKNDRADDERDQAAADTQHAATEAGIARVGIGRNLLKDRANNRTDQTADEAADKGPAAMHRDFPDHQAAEKVDQHANRQAEEKEPENVR